MTTSTPSGNVKQLSNITKKLESAISEGRYYDAEQVYKTLYSRHMAAKKYDELMPLLRSGSVLLLQHREYNAGTELAQLLLEVFTAANKTASSDVLATFREIFQSYPPGASQPGKIVFGKAAVKWLEKHGGSKTDLEEFYYLLANAHTEERDFGTAQKYFLKSSRDEEFARMVQQWLEQGNAAERDLFVARAVLLALCNANLKQANALYDRLASVVGTSSTPLMNFIRFLLLTLERDALPLFETLRKRYAPSLQRDPSFQQYLDTIAQVFYKVRPQSAQAGFGGGMFGEIFKSLMGGGGGQQQQQQNNARKS